MTCLLCCIQVKIFKSDIPADLTEKALNRVNEALDKYQIEKVINQNNSRQ